MAIPFLSIAVACCFTLWTAAVSHDNVHLIDWCSASLNHDEYFDGDGTHLTAEAAVIYNQLIFDNVKSFLPAHENVDAAASNEAVSDGANIGDESTENRA